MKKQVVFVTGAGRGSGEAIAKLFLKNGAVVAATDLVAPSWSVGENEENLIRLAVDVSDEKAVEDAVAFVNSKTTGINVLINNAGIAKPDCPVTDETTAALERMFRVNVEGVFFTVRAVARDLIRRGEPGAIVNVASVAGKNGFQGSSLYGATKAAVIGFTRNLAPELGPHDITVNAICPGSVDTPMIVGVMENISRNTGMSLPEVRKMMESGIPMRRFQTPSDVAALCYFLASDGARNISGESMNLDGGSVRD